jgi:hypothetical protein
MTERATAHASFAASMRAASLPLGRPVASAARALFVLSLLSALATPAAAQQDADEGELPASFSSDRPGFANTTAVAARGRLTTEVGVSASFGDPAFVGALPNLSIRAGVFDFLELRVRGPNGIAIFDGGPTMGLGDPIVGFKIGGRLHESVSISSVFEVSLPIATDGFGSPEATYRADLNLDWRVWGPITITPNLVASVLAEADPLLGGTARFFEGGGSLKVTWQAVDVLALFVQSYVLRSERSDWRAQVGGGLAWMAAPNVQVDASFNAAVTEQGDPPTAEIGTTILW